MFSKDVRKGEIEKNPEMIQAPVVEKMERKIEAANEDIVKAKQEVERLLKEKRQQLETELIEGAKIRYEQTEREVGAETRETLKQIGLGHNESKIYLTLLKIKLRIIFNVIQILTKCVKNLRIFRIFLRRKCLQNYILCLSLMYKLIAISWTAHLHTPRAGYIR